MPTLTNEVKTTNVISNYEAKAGESIRSIFESFVNRKPSDPKVRMIFYRNSVSIDDKKAAIAAAAETDVVKESSRVVSKPTSMSRRTLNSVISAGETAAKVMRFKV